MEDLQIIDLYWKRDEAAITETEKKYGTFCHKIAENILSADEDAKECVNDTYYQAWNAIPPQCPENLRAWLGKVVRNIAINRWNSSHTKKRYAGMTALLSELEECLPAARTVEREIEEKEVSLCINTWLRSLDRDDRILFVRRYWNGDSLGELAEEWQIQPARLAQRMYRLRQKLRAALEKEGICL